MIVILTDSYGRPCGIHPRYVISIRPARDEGLSWINLVSGPNVCVRGTVEEIRNHLNVGLTFESLTKGHIYDRSVDVARQGEQGETPEAAEAEGREG